MHFISASPARLPALFSKTPRPPQARLPPRDTGRISRKGTVLFDTFFLVAGAHLLALLSPGPDFFLIVRTSLLQGWRRASSICVGVALANGIFIALAWSGLSALQPDGLAFTLLQWGGCLYLAWLGSKLLRSPGTPLTQAGGAPALTPLGWRQGLRMGLASGLLNPKNALFYASLFALLGSVPRPVQALYGVWMASVVLGWDLLVAALAGHRSVVDRFARHLRSIERATGAVLLLIAFSVAGHALKS